MSTKHIIAIFVFFLFASHSYGQTCCDEDTSPPEVVSSLDSAVFTCNESHYPVSQVLFSDDCEVMPVVYKSSHVAGDYTTVCSVSQYPDYLGWIGNLWMPYFDGDMENFVFDDAGGSLYLGPDGGYLTGIVENVVDPTYKWEIHLYLENRVDWDEWSALLTTDAFNNRTYKADEDIVNNEEYEDWSYLEIGEGSYMEGLDALDSSFVIVEHQPSNYLFGFQWGLAAGSNPVYEEGFSSWAKVKGIVEGEPYQGVVDYSGLTDCNDYLPELPAIEERVWNAFDPCYNRTTVNQSIHYLTADDVEDELLLDHAIEQIELSCPLTIDDVDVVTARYGCEPVELNVEESVDTDGPCDIMTVTRVYTGLAPDETQIYFEQQIIIEADTEAPIFDEGLPSALPLDCLSSLPDEEQVEALDACSEVEIGFVDEIIGEGCSPDVVRTFTAMDQCGNSSTRSLTYQVNEVTWNMNTIPPDVTIGCDDAIPPLSFPSVNNIPCYPSESSVEINEVPNDCGETIVRTYYRELVCGDILSHDQVIEIIDDVAPTFDGIPADEVHSCEYVVSAPAVLPTGTDNCSDVEVTYQDFVTGVDCDRIIERQFTISDACGNFTTEVQVFTFDQSIVSLEELSASTFGITTLGSGVIQISYDPILDRQRGFVDIYDQRGSLVYNGPLSNEILLDNHLRGILELVIRIDDAQYNYRVLLRP